MLPSFAYARVRTLDEAFEELAAPGAHLHAGGVDLLGCLRDGVFGAEKLVPLSGIQSLSGIDEDEGDLVIGAMTTLAEIAASDLVRARVRGLSKAAESAGSPQLRHQGTLGGNLCQRPRCWYFRGKFECARKGGDTCFATEGENRYHAVFGGGPCFIVHPSDTAPMLVALGAEVELRSSRGLRAMLLEEFFELPSVNLASETALARGEIVTRLRVPSAAGWTTSYRKVRERGAWDFALTSVALAMKLDGRTVEDARVVLGGVAPIPWRSERAEAILRGQTLAPDLARAAGEAAAEGAEPLEQNGYKVQLVRAVVEESLAAL
jgi:xanthine dehydrogenase YagS FAD-binding subunit